jgi:two-component system, chemotaxis family, chemotaxis protein CheY
LAASKKIPILVVDDSQTVRLNVRSFLRAMGFSDIDLAEDGSVALEKLRARGYGLIVSDWTMDRVDGYELLKTVRDDVKLKHIPFIMITASNEPEKVRLAKQAGVNNYIMKPFSIAVLKQKLEAVLGRLE